MSQDVSIIVTRQSIGIIVVPQSSNSKLESSEYTSSSKLRSSQYTSSSKLESSEYTSSSKLAASTPAAAS